MDRHRTKARVASYVLIIIVLAHTAIISLWAGPSNVIKDAIGPQKIRAYVNPVFEQDWHIFAPTPKRVTTDLDFRVRLQDSLSGEITETPWRALVEAENALVRHNPAPPRSAFAARRTSLTLHNATSDMNDEQRLITQEDFTELPKHEYASALREAPNKSGANATKINSYLQYDEMATALATLSGAVLYEGEIIAVQYRTAKRSVPNFEHRTRVTVADVKSTTHDFGWRPPAVVSDVAVTHFAPYAKNIPLAAEQNK